jgi:hypothetical protein
MPIRLNLLAEALAAEEVRRRDPVKRAMWIAGLLVAVMLVWSSSLQLQAMLAKNGLGRVEAQMNSHTNDYRQVLDNQKKSVEINQKLLALQKLSSNRFLNGPVLNALQQTTVEDVELIRLKIDQTYALVEEVKPRTNDTRVVAGKPATITEKIVLALEGKDSSANAGDQVNKFKEAVAKHPYFQEKLGRTNEVSLKNLSAPTISPDTSRACVLFTLECRFPEVTR